MLVRPDTMAEQENRKGLGEVGQRRVKKTLGQQVPWQVQKKLVRARLGKICVKKSGPSWVKKHFWPRESLWSQPRIMSTLLTCAG